MSVLYPLLKPLKDLTRDDLDTVVAPTPALAAVKRARSTGHVSGLNEALAACAPGPARSVDAAWTGLEEKIHTGELAYLDNRPSAAHHRAFIQPIRGHWVVTDQVTGRARAAYTALLSSAAILRPPPRAGGGNGGGTSPTPASSPLPPTQHSEKYAVLPPPRADQRPPPGTPVEHQTTAQSAGDAQSHLVPHAADPINMVLGEESLRITDAVLPGPLPLVWARTYRSSKSDQNNGLGHGWTYPGRATLTLTASTITLHDDDGRRMDFPRPHRDRTSRHLHEGMLLRWEGLHQERLILTQPGRPIRVFERQADGERYRLSQWRHPGYVPSKYHYPRGHSAPQGVALNFHYDPAGRLQRIESTPGPGLVFRRDPHGHITAVHHQTPSGEILQPALATYTYDTQGDLIAHANAQGHGERYTYHHHLLTQRTLTSGYCFHFEWDPPTPQARCRRQWGDQGYYAYTFAWDPANRRSTATNSRGHTRTYAYNAFGLVTHETDPLGQVHTQAYNEAGRLSARTDPLGHLTRYLYDRQQRLTIVDDPLEHAITLGYRSEHDDTLSVVLDAARQPWERTFNDRNLVEKQSAPDQTTTQYTYTDLGLLQTLTDPLGRITTFTWNESAELSQVTDPAGNITHYRYDDWGRITQVTLQAADQALDAPSTRAQTTVYTYTKTGLVASITTDQGTTQLTYNPSGQLTQYTDPQGRTTTYRYDDGLSQPTQRTDALGNTIKYRYDSERNLIALINENGDTYQFFYDANERLIKEIGFDGRVQEYTYNPAGQLIQHRDANEVITTFERDPLGQLLQKHSRRVSDTPTTIKERARFRYDVFGRLTETDNEHCYLEFGYDVHNHLIAERHTPIQDGKPDPSRRGLLQHQLNPLGQRTQTILPDGQTLTYEYDSTLGFSGVSLNNTPISQLQRDSLGRELTRQQGALTTHTDYDPQGRLLQQQAFNKETKHRPIQREYGYDPAGNVRWVDDGGDKTVYVYDALNRLKHAANADAEFFAFDPAGNLLLMGDDLTKPKGQVQGNRLRMRGDKKFEYDARGNLTQENSGKEGKLQKQFIYNLNNQLIKVQSNPPDQVIEFKYDSLGRRVEKRDAFGTTTFIWADNLLMQEQRNNTQKTYLYEPGSFRPLAQIQDGHIYHYHLDHLGTPRELTNNEGKIVWKAKYKTYGNLAVKEVEEVENNLRFQGQYYDPETGLHYNRFRYYSPESGQFINQDPIGLLGGLNNYQYACDPLRWIDPLGLCPESAAQYAQLKEHYQSLDPGYIPSGPRRVGDPINYEYANRIHPTGVRFTPDGYPDLEPYAIHKVEISQTGNNLIDFKNANIVAGIGSGSQSHYAQLPGNTWHHHQNGTTMLLVPSSIHGAPLSHSGGAEIARKVGGLKQ